MLVLAFATFLLGALFAVAALRSLASSNRTLLYQILSIDTSFAPAQKQRSSPPTNRRDVSPPPSVAPLTVKVHPQPEILELPISRAPEPPQHEVHNLPTDQSLYAEQSQLAKRKPRGSLEPEGHSRTPLGHSPSTSRANLTVAGFIQHREANANSPSVPHHSQSSNAGTPLSGSGRLDSHSGTHKTPDSHSRDKERTPVHSEDERSSAKDKDHHDKKNRHRGTPLTERAGSATSAEIEKNKRKAEIAAFYSAEQYSAWVEIGSVMAKKLKWKWRFIVVQGGWLHYYKEADKRANNCCGWVMLSSQEIYERPKKPGQIVIKNMQRKGIFHRHGPDPSVPPAKKDGFFFGHRKSAKCRLRVKDKDKLEELLVHLKRASMTNTVSTYIESDDEDEDFSEDASFKSSDEEVMLPVHTLAQSDQPVSNQNPAMINKVPSDISATARPRKMSRAESIIIVQPDAGSIQEVTAPQEFIQSRRNTLRYSLIGVSSPLADRGAAQAQGLDTTAAESEALNAPAEEELLEDSVSTDNREGLGKILAKAIGLDLTTIALPVTINEPQSFLQRMCEAVQYYELLNKADTLEDPNHRMTYVAAFAATAYSCNTRTTKPFNPYLGETFELVRPDGFKYLGEQVSHHPPIGAGTATTPHFEFFEEQGVKSKFGGNSLNIETVGVRQLTLRKRNDFYTWGGIKTTAHNILLGEMWLDHYGRAEITCPSTKTTAILEFTKCGWFSKGRYEVKGWIVDSNGKTVINLEGKWVEQLEATVLHGPNFPGATNKTSVLWKHTSLPDQPEYKYKFSPFCREMNKRDCEAILPPTDSRLRKDRIALEDLDIKTAGMEKRLLEERERRLRKTRETKGVVWKPKYFTQDQDNAWTPTNASGYWAERQQRCDAQS